MDKIKEATKLVDIILSDNYKEYKIIKYSEKLVEQLISEVENKLDHVPDQDMPDLYQDVSDELSKDEEQEEESKEEEFEDDEDEINNGEEEFEDDEFEEDEEEYSVSESILSSVRNLLKENEYKEFFKNMLKKWNINSPTELDDSKKKEFFAAVDKEWKAKKESD